MAASKTRDDEGPAFYVYLRGTWSFDHSAWGDSAEEVLDQAMDDMAALHGSDFLDFSEVEVSDENTEEKLLTWTPDGLQRHGSSSTGASVLETSHEVDQPAPAASQRELNGPEMNGILKGGSFKGFSGQSDPSVEGSAKAVDPLKGPGPEDRAREQLWASRRFGGLPPETPQLILDLDDDTC